MENFTGEFVQEVDNGKVILSFKDGKKDGVTKFIDKNGITLSEINYKNDLIHGEIRQYYPNGTLLSIINYEYGIQNGSFTSFYESGMKQLETSYKDGKTDGLFSVYDEFGDKINECLYKDGQKHGKNIIYYPRAQGGTVYEVSYYENGLLTNDKMTFYSNGEIMSTTPYIKGKAQAYSKNFTLSGSETKNR